MDKNDPFNRPSGDAAQTNDEEHEFIDDARYDDPNAPEVREAEYAAGQEEWDQPIDELAEEEQSAAAQPPQQKHDPFADEGPVEDEFSEHAEGEHEIEEPGEESAPSSARSNASAAGMKPPSSLMKYLPIVGGGVAAVVIAFFGLQQFMGGSETPSTQPSLEHQNTWDSASANPPQNNSTTQTAANEFQPLQQPEQQAEQQPAVQQPSETSSNMITPTATQNTQAPLPQGETTTTPPQQASNPLEARITELTQQLETMKQTQDDLNQKLQAATATPPSMDESSKAAQQALVDRIAQLEQKLSSASSSSSEASPSIDAPAGKASRKSKRTAATTDDSSSDTTSRNSKKASVDFMAAKKTKRPKRRASVDANSTSGTEGYAPMNSRPFQGWILRSAQPGSAWLSQGATSSDLRRVVPGDKVQGLGTVTAIRQVAGRWIVEGTQGAVR